MKSLITFQISELQSIRIVIDEQNKKNIYGYKAKGLHVFDEVVVEYVHGNYVLVLAKDSVQQIITVFFSILKEVFKNKLQLGMSLEVGKVGSVFSWAMYTRSDGLRKENDIFSDYWVWSSSDSIQTWLYNVNNKIYLEISKTYPWIFSDPEEGESYISFDEYMGSYYPELVVELSEPLVRTWIDQCHKILQSIEVV
jgi:hypothetical protein